MNFNLPNLLTWLRILIIPILVLSFYLPFQFNYLCALGLFILASLTDWFDGFLARRWQQTSRFGAFLDPVADKLVVIVALILLVAKYQLLLITIPTIIITSREIVISALREWMALVGKAAQVTVNWPGKVKTSCQMIAIIFLLLQPLFWSNFLLICGIIALNIAAILAVYSMIIYFRSLSGLAN